MNPAMQRMMQLARAKAPFTLNSRSERLPDPPVWFERARDRTLRRSLPAAPELPEDSDDVSFNAFNAAPRRSGVTPKPCESRWLLIVGILASASLIQSMVAVPAALVAGYYLHRPEKSGTSDAAVAVQNFDRGNFAARPFFKDQPQAAPNREPVVNLPVPAVAQRPPVVIQQVIPDERPSPERDERDRLAARREQLRRESNRAIPVAAPVEKPLEPFALQPVAHQHLADVQVPQNSWFSLANGAQCDGGACQLVPVNRTDRKLNTALEWETSPKQAADKATRDGKLVFLIHVSGNFAQPGFT